MRRALLLLMCTCGGPSQSQLVETPSATAPADHAEAPPASTSDKDRERLIQSFDDMETTQHAYEEAGQANRAAPPPPLSGQPPPPKKKGVAEQAEMPKKKGVAEQAEMPKKK
ncbi:MAG TPA: hypothetical protein VIV11_18200 [Kofleriaceae bacterium]